MDPFNQQQNPTAQAANKAPMHIPNHGHKVAMLHSLIGNVMSKAGGKSISETVNDIKQAMGAYKNYSKEWDNIVQQMPGGQQKSIDPGMAMNPSQLNPGGKPVDPGMVRTQPYSPLPYSPLPKNIPMRPISPAPDQQPMKPQPYQQPNGGYKIDPREGGGFGGFNSQPLSPTQPVQPPSPQPLRPPFQSPQQGPSDQPAQPPQQVRQFNAPPQSQIRYQLQ